MEKVSPAGEALPLVAMIAVVLVGNGLATISKSALSSGLNQYVFIVYYDAVGTIMLLPWFSYRYFSGKTPPITFSLLCRFFGLGLIAKCLSAILYYSGLSYSSITVAAAIGNLIPIFTSLLAVSLSFRMEKLNLRVLTDQVKVSGMLVAVLGALIVTLYKGPALFTPDFSSDSPPQSLHSENPDWILGCICFTVGYLLSSLWSIIQTDTMKSFPDEVAIIFFTTLFGAIQNAAAAVFLVEDEKAWQLHHKMDYVAILYAGFSLSVFSLVVVTWCLHKKGPIYVSMFSPFNVAVASVIGFVFLKDVIYVGSVIGSSTIVVGFYAVMWAQAKNKTYSTSTPLLQSSHT